MNISGLFSAAVTAPDLPGARCRKRQHLFDDAQPGEKPDVTEQRHLAALGLCAVCPALQPCAQWLNSLPQRRKPYGVVAGRIRTEKRR